MHLILNINININNNNNNNNNQNKSSDIQTCVSNNTTFDIAAHSNIITKSYRVRFLRTLR